MFIVENLLLVHFMLNPVCFCRELVVSGFYVKPCMFYVENLLLVQFMLNPVCFM